MLRIQPIDPVVAQTGLSQLGSFLYLLLNLAVLAWFDRTTDFWLGWLLLIRTISISDKLVSV